MRKIQIETPAGNGRFGASGAITPQTILCEIERYYPAASAVEAPPAPSRWGVKRKRRTAQQDNGGMVRKENE